jgi:hypothetical protein
VSVQKPSDSGKNVKDRVRGQWYDGKPGNVFDDEVQLELLLSVFGSKPTERCDEVAGVMMAMIDRFKGSQKTGQGDAAGVFVCPQSEPTLSCLLTPIIARLFDEKEISVCHQLFSRADSTSTPSCPMDITIVKDCDHCLIPVCVFELAREGSACNKQFQGFAYAQNCFKHYFPPQKHCAVLVVLLAATGDIELRFVYDAGDGKKFTDLKIFSCDPFDQAGLARVLSGIVWWTRKFQLPTKTSTNVNSSTTGASNVAIRDGREVLKLYDYRGYHRQHLACQRSPAAMLAHAWISGAKVES